MSVPPPRLAYPSLVATEQPSPGADSPHASPPLPRPSPLPPLETKSRDEEPPREPSSWSRLRAVETANGSSAGSRAASMRQTAASMWRSTAGVRAALRGSAEKVSAEMGDRFQKATDALDEPAGAELDDLISSADLPALDLADPIASIVARLDRESDLFRGLALRALSRAGWADRIAQGSGILTGLGAGALAVIAGLGALFGAEGAAARVVLIAAALGSLVVGAAVVTWISSGIRKAQREVARDAMERADLAELRLHRIGLVSALLQMDEALGRQAIERLERDVSAPPR